MLFGSRNKLFAVLGGALAFVVACTPTPEPSVVPPTAIVMAPAAQSDNAANAFVTQTTIAQHTFATLTAAAPQAVLSVPTPLATVTPPPPPLEPLAPTDAPTPMPNAPGENAPTLPPPTFSGQLSPSVTPLPQLPTRPPTSLPVQTATAAPTQISRETLAGKILFKSTRRGGKYPNNFKWFVMNGDGSAVEQVDAARAKALYQDLKGQEGYSPDRTMLVLGERTCAPNAHCDLYVGAPEMVMNRSQGQWTPPGPRWYRADNPAWSPRGDWIAFIWNRDNERTKNIFKGDPYKLNQDFKRLTDFGGRRDTKELTFSPDGSMLAFATQDGPRWQIWVLNADAENPTDAAAHNLSNADADDWDPLWIK